MPTTEAQLIQFVLENLNVLPAGAAASAADIVTVRNRLRPALDKLNDLGVPLSSDTADMDAITDSIVLPLAVWIANELAAVFGVDAATRAGMQSDADRAFSDLMRIYRAGFAGRTMRLEHFWGRRHCGVRF